MFRNRGLLGRMCPESLTSISSLLCDNTVEIVLKMSGSANNTVDAVTQVQSGCISEGLESVRVSGSCSLEPALPQPQSWGRAYNLPHSPGLMFPDFCLHLSSFLPHINMPNEVAWVLFSGEMAKVLGLPVVIAGRSRPAGQLS